MLAPSDGRVGGQSAALEVNQLNAGYTRVPVVTDFSLRAERGHVCAVIGPNGSGKSTMLKGIVGLVDRSGRVLYEGQDISHWPTHRIVRSGIAYVPQERNVFPSLTVLENLEAGALFSAARVRAGLAKAFGIFPDLEVASKKRAGALSAGQRTMLAIARVLISDPSVVLFDEPTAGLAPSYVQRVWDRIRDIARANVAVVVVEQAVELALDNSDFVSVLVAGRSVLSGTPQEVRARDLPAIFLGSLESATNRR